VIAYEKSPTSCTKASVVAPKKEEDGVAKNHKRVFGSKFEFCAYKPSVFVNKGHFKDIVM